MNLEAIAMFRVAIDLRAALTSNSGIGEVMGGVMLLLFGMIASVGSKNLIQDRADLDKPRNLIIVSLILVVGIGDLSLNLGRFQMGGIGLAGIVGIVLNLLLPKKAA